MMIISRSISVYLKQEGNGRRNTVTTARIANISIDVHFFYAKETMQKDDGWVGAVRRHRCKHVGHAGGTYAAHMGHTHSFASLYNTNLSIHDVGTDKSADFNRPPPRHDRFQPFLCSFHFSLLVVSYFAFGRYI